MVQVMPVDENKWDEGEMGPIPEATVVVHLKCGQGWQGSLSEAKSLLDWLEPS